MFIEPVAPRCIAPFGGAEMFLSGKTPTWGPLLRTAPEVAVAPSAINISLLQSEQNFKDQRPFPIRFSQLAPDNRNHPAVHDSRERRRLARE